MPHLGAQTPDAQTIDLIRQWIDELDSPEAGELVFAVDVDVVNQRGNQPVSKALAMALDALTAIAFSNSPKGNRSGAAAGAWAL